MIEEIDGCSNEIANQLTEFHIFADMTPTLEKLMLDSRLLRILRPDDACISHV